MSNLTLALRALRRSPAFTIVTVLTMAIAIGATSTMFSVFDRLVLNAVTVSDPASLVTIWFNNPQRNIQNPSSSVPRYLEMRDHTRSFSSVALSAFDSFTLTGDGHATQLNGLRVTASFFPTLGIQPARGRNFTTEEDTPGGPAVCILSHEAWQAQFGAREDLVGGTVDLNGTKWQVVGILPPGITAPFRQTQVFAPRVGEVSGLTPQQIEAGATFAQPIARLKPGVTIEQAGQELAAFSHTYRERYPARLDAHNVSEPRSFASTLTAGLEPTMYTLLGAVACVLLIALANVASLFLTRLLGRRKEVAVRLSLGAGRSAIIRQCLTESVAFCTLAGVTGVLIAMGSLRLLNAAIAPQLPPNTIIAMNWRVLLFTMVVTLVSAAVIGLFPALQASRPALVDSLKDSARGSSTAHGSRVRQALIVVEVALSVVLLVGAGLLLVSFVGLQRTDPGFRSTGGAAAFMSLAPARYATGPQQSQFVDDVLERLRAQAGVTGAAAALSPPLSGFSPRTPYGVSGEPVKPLPERPLATMNVVSDDYFRILQIPVIAGREFGANDRSTSPRVGIVNETFARRIFNGQPAVGRSLLVGRDGTPPVEIVGVIRDVRSIGLNVPAPDEIYLAARQLPRTNFSLIATTNGDAAGLQPAIQAAVEAVDQSQAISFFGTLDSNITTSIGTQQLLAALTGIFAALALGLAVMGLYSVLAYLVAQRTNEIGIRMALGASRSQVVGLVMRNGMMLVATGLVIGLAAAAGAGRLIQQLLVNVTPFSPSVYVTVAAIFATVAAIACAAPSLRASRIDPLKACRTE